MVRRSAVFALLALACFLPACGDAVSVPTGEDRNLLEARSTAALADMKRANASLDSLLSHAHAYVIFPSVVTGAFGGLAADDEETGDVVGIVFDVLKQQVQSVQLAGHA